MKTHHHNIIHTKLHIHQINLLLWAKNLILFKHSGIINMPTGSGKTLSYLSIHNLSPFNKSLIVAPASLLNQIKANIISHSNLDLNQILIFNNKNRNKLIQPFTHAQIIVISYSTLRIEYKNKNISLIYNSNFSHTFFDEAHYFKNINITWHAAYNIKSNFKWPSSATPIVNKHKDLLNIAHLITNFSHDDFDIQYISTFFIFSNIKSIKTHLSTHFHHTPLSKPQLYQYNQTIKNMTPSIQKITLLQQLTIHSKHKFKSHPLDNPRFKTIINIIKDIPINDKIIITSKFSSILDLLITFLKEFNTISFIRSDNHSNIIKFNLPKGPRILIANIQKIQTGHNLQIANHIIFLEPQWNQTQTHQTIDRIYRFGQIKQCHAHFLFHSQSIEFWIFITQKFKANLANHILLNKLHHNSHATKTLKSFAYNKYINTPISSNKPYSLKHIFLDIKIPTHNCIFCNNPTPTKINTDISSSHNDTNICKKCSKL